MRKADTTERTVDEDSDNQLQMRASAPGEHRLRCWLEPTPTANTQGAERAPNLGGAGRVRFRWYFWGVAWIKSLMGSIDVSISQGLGPRVQRDGPVRRLRAPWRRGAWSAREVALALQAQRAELLVAVRTRGDARGVPVGVLEEVVSEAICIVVMMRRPVACEEHLMGAFWTAVQLLLGHYREGRRGLRVGRRARVEFDAVAGSAVAESPGPEELVELKDRVARAADFVAQLSDLERDVVAVMAVRGTGVKLTARILGLPVKTVRAAERSAQSKLDRVAVIAAAGRMCDYRESSVAAYATGSAEDQDERLARAHLAACAPCRGTYTQLVRDMQSRGFQSGAAAAFLPVPLGPLGHHLGPLGRILGLLTDHSLPVGGPGERAAEILGGAGVVKVAAAGGAVVMATATLATGIHTLVMPSPQHAPPKHHHTRRPAQHVPALNATAQTVTVSGRAADSNVVGPRSSVPPARRDLGLAHLTPRQHAELEFASLGAGSSTPSSRNSKPPTASVASVQTSSSTVGGSGNSESSTAGSGSVDSRPSMAAREFGQP